MKKNNKSKYDQILSVLLVPLFLQSAFVLADFYFTVTKSNTRLVSSLLYSLIGINGQQCVVECSYNKACWSVNHHQVRLICELNKAVSLTMKNQLLTTDAGWSYYEKSEGGNKTTV